MTEKTYNEIFEEIFSRPRKSEDYHLPISRAKALEMEKAGLIELRDGVWHIKDQPPVSDMTDA